MTIYICENCGEEFIQDFENDVYCGKCEEEITEEVEQIKATEMTLQRGMI